MKCEICDKEYSNYISLGTHIVKQHKISTKQYYDTYLKQENEGFCLICNKDTKFRGLAVGYLRHCSKKCSMSDSNTIKKYKSTMQKKYSVDYSFQRSDVIEKSHSLESRKKKIQSYIDHYGVDNPAKDITVKEKIKNTNMNRYGVICNLNLPQVISNAQSKKAKQLRVEHAKQTCLNKYNVENPWQLPEVIEKSHSKESLEKINNTKRKNHTFNTSKSEDSVYSGLIKFFDIDDIERNYKSDKYPYLCDFYIKSLDLYIECNFHWTHGGHWYNSETDSLDIWNSKAENSKYYRNAIQVWSIRDKEKRNIAKQNKLNYVVFWTYNDFLLWMSLNCPNGKDWQSEYSWIIYK